MYNIHGHECNLAIMGNETKLYPKRMPIVSAGIITPVIAPAYFTDMGQCTLSAHVDPPYYSTGVWLMTINGMFRALIPGINIFSPSPHPPSSAPSTPFMHRKLAHTWATLMRVYASPVASSLLLLDQRINLSIGGGCFNSSKTVIWSVSSNLRMFPCVLLFLD